MGARAHLLRHLLGRVCVSITAHGTTVNGTTFHGDVLGPVANPGSYDVRGPNTIQFGP